MLLKPLSLYNSIPVGFCGNRQHCSSLCVEKHLLLKMFDGGINASSDYPPIFIKSEKGGSTSSPLIYVYVHP